MRQEGQIVELQDDTSALIRPIQPGDRERLNEGFLSASDESNFLRFLSPHPRLSSSQLDYLTSVDHHCHEALIAVDPETGQSFGTARYIRHESHPERAEFAIGLGDRWMGIGLGTSLLSALARNARAAGVTELTATIHPDNAAVRRLIERVLGGYRVVSVGQGAVDIAVDLRAGAEV
jgi:RimJ/RimL family protein N-acetyltransferase